MILVFEINTIGFTQMLIYKKKALEVEGTSSSKNQFENGRSFLVMWGKTSARTTREQHRIQTQEQGKWRCWADFHRGSACKWRCRNSLYQSYFKFKTSHFKPFEQSDPGMIFWKKKRLLESRSCLCIVACKPRDPSGLSGHPNANGKW